MYKYLLTILISGFCFALIAQQKPTITVVKDSLESEQFIRVIEQTLEDYFLSIANENNYDSILKSLSYNSNTVPSFSDEVYCNRLEEMKTTSSYPFDCNVHTLSTIKYFAKSRISFAKIILARSSIYFDMYEETLAKYDLPLELKYLSVIESGLRPQVKSPAGALGLWQFMYGSGKMYGLNENSYIDERMDPAKATDAACRYLKKLYGIYADWNLALAAYNYGPGNINKAIRRSGGKTSYWEIRPFLPKETQAYVPTFIAVSYLLTYHLEHNIKPAPVKQTYYQLDTVCFKQNVHMSTISELISWKVEEITALNPVYKTHLIAGYPRGKNCITGPLTKIGALISLEDSLYTLENNKYSPKPLPSLSETLDINSSVADSTGAITPVLEASPSTKTTYIYHKVRSGETLTKIAAKYGVSNSDILKANNLHSSRMTVGKSLKIPKTVTIATPKISVDKPLATKESEPVKVDNALKKDTTVEIYHIVKRNESLTMIASKYNTTVDEIKRWNNLESTWLNVDQKLRILHTIKANPSSAVSTVKTNATVAPVEVPIKPVVAPKPVEKKEYYTIKSGDLFNKIAVKHNITMEQLKKLNPDVNPDRIREGQKIRVK